LLFRRLYMGNANFTQFSYGMLRKPVKLVAAVAIGGTGAPTLKAWSPATGGAAASYSNATTPPGPNAFSPPGTQGVASISRGGTGLYDIVLQGAYQRVVGVKQTTINTTGISAAPDVGIVQATPGSGFVAGSDNKTIRVQMTAGGIAADPASGDIVLFTLELDDSSAV
jgi:hypothetical protein